MHFLNKKLKRDIFQNWTQFFSVFLMALLSVLVYVGLEGVWHSMQTSINRFAEESNLADSWIHAIEFTEEDINLIMGIEGVYEISVKTTFQVSAQIADINTYIFLETPGTGDISIPTIVDGSSVYSYEDGIWINLEYAEVHHISVGDEITIEFQGMVNSLIVRGIIQSPARIHFTGTSDFVAPQPNLFGYGIIAYQSLETILNHSPLPNLVEVRGGEGDVRRLAPELLGAQFISYFNQNSLFDVSNAVDRVGQVRGLSILFSFIFVLLSILTMFTTIKRLIETQLKEVATLGALGFSSKVISLHYSSYGLFVGGAGALVGALCAPLISLIVLETQKNTYSLPEWYLSYTWTSLLVITMVTFICTLSAFIASKKSRSVLPALYLRGNTIKTGKPTFLEKITFIWNKLLFGSRWAWRDALSNPVRILMGIVGVAGSMMLLMAGLGMPNTLYGQRDDAFGREFTYTSQIRVSILNTNEQNYDLQHELDGQWIQRLPARTTPDDGLDRLLTIFDEGNYIQLRTIEDEPMQQDGVYITEGFAIAVSLDVGDYMSLRVSMDTTEYEFQVVGILPSSTPQGIYISSENWRNAGGAFQPQIMLLGDGHSADELRDDSRIEQVIAMVDQRDSATEMIQNLYSIFALIIGFASLLVVVILYNLGALNFTERRRDYATLLVLGLHKQEIRKLAMVENIITTLIGWILGIPAGFWFLTQYVATHSTDQLIYYPYLRTRSLVIASCIAIGCSLTTTFLLGRRITKTDMVEAIKGVE